MKDLIGVSCKEECALLLSMRSANLLKQSRTTNLISLIWFNFWLIHSFTLSKLETICSNLSRLLNEGVFVKAL